MSESEPKLEQTTPGAQETLGGVVGPENLNGGTEQTATESFADYCARKRAEADEIRELGNE